MVLGSVIILAVTGCREDGMMANQADVTLMETAARSHGVVTRSRLLDLGLSRDTVDRQIGQLLRPVGAGLFVVDPLVDQWTPLALATAAVPGGAVARESAAHLHGSSLYRSDRYRTDDLHVVAPNSVRSRHEFATFHQTRFLPPQHLVEVCRLLVTTVARALCDLAMQISPLRLRRLVEVQATTSTPSLDELVRCHQELAKRGRRGTRPMRDVLEALVTDDPFPESELELRTEQALTTRGLWLRRQFRPPWYDGIRYIVDFADVSSRTILEADGRRFHDTSAAFEDDRRRDRLAASHGWLTLRVTWRDVFEDRHALDEVADIIRRRRPTQAIPAA